MGEVDRYRTIMSVLPLLVPFYAHNIFPIPPALYFSIPSHQRQWIQQLIKRTSRHNYSILYSLLHRNASNFVIQPTDLPNMRLMQSGPHLERITNLHRYYNPSSPCRLTPSTSSSISSTGPFPASHHLLHPHLPPSTQASKHRCLGFST